MTNNSWNTLHDFSLDSMSNTSWPVDSGQSESTDFTENPVVYDFRCQNMCLCFCVSLCQHLMH